jgi:glycosyltransferase involved in cell wall biosynthesis
MAAGVPVLATRVEGIPEAIRDGIDGLIVPAGNPWALATAIDSIVAGKIDCSTLRANASQRQATQFSDRSMAQGVANVYRRVLARRARP